MEHAGAEANPHKKSRLTAKEFIKIKQAQMKETNVNADNFSNLRVLMLQGTLEQFAQSFSKMKPDLALIFLFSENEFRVTSLMDMITNDHYQFFLTLVNSWCVDNTAAVDGALQVGQNKLALQDWFNKFVVLSRTATQKFIKLHGENKGQVLIDLLGKQNGLFFKITKIYMDLDAIISITNSFKVTDFVLKELYLKLMYETSLAKVLNPRVVLEVQAYYNYRLKDTVWTAGSFSQFLETVESSTFQILRLDEMSYNFWHELAETNSKQFLTILEMLPVRFKDNPYMKQAIEKMLEIFDNSYETPIDKCLKMWSSASIKRLFTFAETIPRLRLSTNALNKIIDNHCLKQDQKDELIVECLTGSLSKKGYLKRTAQKAEKMMKIRKRQKQEGNESQSFYFCEIDMLTSTSSIQQDPVCLLTHQQANSYPLIRYLNSFKHKSTLSILQCLLLPDLEKQITRQKLIHVMNQLKIKTISCLRESELHREIRFLIEYYQPLWKFMTKLFHGEVLQYLISKVFINTYEIKVSTNGPQMEFDFVCNHFIRFYIENNPCLEDDNINQSILVNIFEDSSQNNISLIANIVSELEFIKSLNSLHKFHESNHFLVVSLRSRFRNYLDLLPVEELLKPIQQWSGLTILDVISTPFGYDGASILSIEDLIAKFGEQKLRQYSYCRANLKRALAKRAQKASQVEKSESIV